MATIPRPYTRQVQAYNPQRSAATGRPQALLEELSPAMRYRPQAPVSQMLYSAPPSAEQVPMVDYFGGGPGIAGEGLEGPANPSHGTIAGVLGSLAKGFMGDIPGIVFGLGSTALNDARGKNSVTDPTHLSIMDNFIANAIFGYDINDAKDEYSGLASANPDYGSSGNIGSGVNPATGEFGGYEGAMFGPPPSSLADIGIGGGFGTAGDVGNAGFGGLGGVASY